LDENDDFAMEALEDKARNKKVQIKQDLKSEGLSRRSGATQKSLTPA
jgi:hypothetical protein